MSTIIIKATQMCNSNCAYCDAIHNKDCSDFMSSAVLEKLLFRVNEYLEHFVDQEMQLIWHGGEPLLLGVDFFQNIYEAQARICSNTKERIEHAIQSNLTLLTEELIHVLKQLNINQFGSSYDPEDHIRGFGPNINTRKYTEKFMNGEMLASSNGMTSGVIYVVTKKSLKNPMQIFHFLNNLKPGGGFNLNPVLIYGNDLHELAITPEEYVEFLGAIFPHWWAHQERYPTLQPFNFYKENIVENKLSLGCVDSGSCAFHHFNVNTDGDVSQCGRASDWKILDYGNIFEKSLIDTLSDPCRVDLNKRVAYLKDNDCKECRFWDLCHGGCPLDAWSIDKNIFQKTSWCYIKRGFISKYFEPITGYIFNGHKNERA